MNRALYLGYEGAARLARTLAALAPRSEHKLVGSFAARRGVLARVADFQRDRSRALLWMHAPSVGEGLQARPVLELARAQSPNLQLAYTYFSPSARAFASSLDVDFRDVLPFDAAADMRRAVAALAPTALVFSKVDVWPTLAREASRAGARLGLVSATLGAGSSRRSRVASALLRDAYSRLDRVGAISADDADRLVALGVPSGRVTVTGDTRYDQVWARAAKALAAAPLLDPLRSDRPTLVAGSTWPSDESKLLSAWERVRAARPEARLIIAPHEPTPAHLEPIERWARDSALRLRRLSASDAGDADVILVDRLGVLGDLYSIADMAYVGGAFHAAGLHSVLEPAAFGVPVLFGPRHTASRDATLLLDADAAVSASDAAGLERTLRLWLTAPEARLAAGAAARAVVHRGLGAAARSFALVLELLGG